MVTVQRRWLDVIYDDLQSTCYALCYFRETPRPCSGVMHAIHRGRFPFTTGKTNVSFSVENCGNATVLVSGET